MQIMPARRGPLPEGPAEDADDTTPDVVEPPAVAFHNHLCTARTLYVVRDWHDADKLNKRLGSDGIAVPYSSQLAGYEFHDCVVLTDPVDDTDYVWLREILTPQIRDINEDEWWVVAVSEYYEMVGTPPVRPAPRVLH